VVFYDFDVLCAGVRPAKANPELVVHADAVLPGAIAPERFKPVARRYAKVIYPARDLQLPQLASSHRFDVRPSPNPAAVSQGFRVGAFERPDHVDIITLGVINVKRDAATACRRRVLLIVSK